MELSDSLFSEILETIRNTSNLNLVDRVRELIPNTFDLISFQSSDFSKGKRGPINNNQSSFASSDGATISIYHRNGIGGEVIQREGASGSGRPVNVGDDDIFYTITDLSNLELQIRTINPFRLFRNGSILAVIG